MVLNVAPKLIHRAQWEHRTNVTSSSTDMYGGHTTISSVSTVNCYAFQEERMVVRSSGASEALLEWNVILPKAKYMVQEEDSLTNIYDKKGNLIHLGGRIREVRVYRKWDSGVEVVHVILKNN